MKCKIRIIQELYEVFPQYCPQVGKIYDAEYIDTSKKDKRYKPVCIVTISNKRIVVREGEFEIVRFE